MAGSWPVNYIVYHTGYRRQIEAIVAMMLVIARGINDKADGRRQERLADLRRTIIAIYDSAVCHYVNLSIIDILTVAIPIVGYKITSE